MKRKIIRIDENKCDGCGLCTQGCPEGAIKIIDGKAKLVGELYCDGLGACIGSCPQGAITIEEREAESYDEAKTMENIVSAGKGAIAAHLKHLKEHGQEEYLKQAYDYLRAHKIEVPAEVSSKESLPCGCPGTMMRDFRTDQQQDSKPVTLSKGTSRLRQWPIQLKLLNPQAPYFKHAELVIAADCVPFSYPDFHERFLKGKTLIIFCPKLDQAQEQYVEKLAGIFTYNDIKSVTLVYMEVPCCFGLVRLVEQAIQKSGKNITVKKHTISVRGEEVEDGKNKK